MTEHNTRCEYCGQWRDIHGGPNQGVHTFVEPTTAARPPGHAPEHGDDLTPTSTDALRAWVIRAGFSVRRRDAALAALDAFDAALRGES